MAPLSRLDADAILAVVQHLPLPSRLHFGATCRRVAAVVRKWPPVSLDLAGTHEQMVVGCLKWAMQNAGQNLVALNLHGFQLEIDELLDDVLSRCNRIQVLSIAHCPKATDRSLHSIRRHISGTIRELCLWSAGTCDHDRDADSNLTGGEIAQLLTECRALEAIDLRSQNAVVAEHMALMADLPRLAKFSLAGTSCTAESFAKVLASRSDTIVRAGAMQLSRGSASSIEIPPCPKLTELQISYAPVRVHVNLRDLPNLRYIGATQTSHTIDWADLKGSNVRQICTDPNAERPVLWEGLQSIASQLVHLSLISYSRAPTQEAAMLPDLVPALRAMVALEQLNICPCTAAHLAAMSKLPNLRCLHLYCVSRFAWGPVLAHADPLPIGTYVRVDDSDEGIIMGVDENKGTRKYKVIGAGDDGQPRTWEVEGSSLELSVDGWEVNDVSDVGFFPALTELSLTQCQVDPEMLAASFRSGMFPELKVFHISRTLARFSFPPNDHHNLLGEDRFPTLSQVVDLLDSLPRTKDGSSQMEELSLPIIACGNPKIDPMVGLPEGPRAKVEDVAEALARITPKLRSLHLPTSLCTPEAAKVLCPRLPFLKVLGPRLGSSRFEEEGFRGVRTKVEYHEGCRKIRWLNRNNAHGYAEGSAVKPDCSFMRFMEFAIDPVYSYTRLDDDNEPWQSTEQTAGGADTDRMDEDCEEDVDARPGAGSSRLRERCPDAKSCSMN